MKPYSQRIVPFAIVGAAALFWSVILASCAYSQEFVPVPVPNTISPILQWIMGIASSLLVIFVPILALLLKQHFGLQADATRADMINGAITRGAHLADVDMEMQHLTLPQVGVGTPTMTKALDYVVAAYPDAVKATAEATDEHLSDAITAELHRIQLAKGTPPVPSVVISPVSALR